MKFRGEKGCAWQTKKFSVYMFTEYLAISFDLPVVKSSWELKRLVALVAREFGALAGGRG